MHNLNDKKLLIDGLWMRLGVSIFRLGVTEDAEEYRRGLVGELTHLLSCNAPKPLNG